MLLVRSGYGMSYTPNNVCVYLKAQAGCLAGLGAAGSSSGDSNFAAMGGGGGAGGNGSTGGGVGGAGGAGDDGYVIFFWIEPL
jgi:hypothetical protein